MAYRDIKDRNEWFKQTSKWLIDKKIRLLLPDVCVFARIEFSYKLPFKVGWQQNLLRENKYEYIWLCMKYNLSVIWDKLHFLFECPACNDYCTKFVLRDPSFLSCLHHIIFVDLCLPQTNKNNSSDKKSKGIKNHMACELLQKIVII